MGVLKFVFLGMLKIVLLGTGNLALHLFEAFTSSEVARVVQVFGRNSKTLGYYKDKVVTTNNPEDLRKADIYICAVSDDAIATVSQYPQDQEALIIHCSGAVPLTALPTGSKRGVFYPVQSFSKNRKIDFSRVPICVEAESQEVLDNLVTLGKSISDISPITCYTGPLPSALRMVSLSKFCNLSLRKPWINWNL